VTQARPVLVLAGGTGGHVFPGLAVAAELGARGIPVAWLGATGGLETRLVPERGIPLRTLAITGVRGRGAAALLLAPLRLARAVVAARGILAALMPRCVIAFGGYAAAPGGIAARLARIPLVVHEQNRVAGTTNRLLARFATRVLSGFADVFARGETVGNPVRAAIAALPPPRERMAGREGPLRLLVLGGSQGARALNATLPAVLTRLGTPVDVRHQCGARNEDAVRAAYAESGVACEVVPFIDDMAAAYSWADLVVCRAGALTLAELCAAGVAGVLVPFPHAIDDHQRRNAEVLVECGAAVLVRESDGFARGLGEAVGTLAADAARRLAMADAARSLARPDAAARIADICLEVAA
jgi:UDP-N-acetylglucosamine--N-acetylmuramyl-(pentapeptide) pyrophosphoryl-undecaprenol N-acetylglucosamine transferase